MENPALPTFFLYGEPQRVADPEFLHVETLAQRSRPSGWIIDRHKHADLNHVICVGQGGGTIQLEADDIQFEGARIMVIPAGVVHGFHWTENCEGMILTLADLYLNDLLSRHPPLSPLFGQMQTIAPEHGLAQQTLASMQSMRGELSWSGPATRAAIEGSLLTIFASIFRAFQTAHNQPVQSPRHSNLVARYKQLIEARYRLRESVEEYATHLAVSPTTLREACAQAGQSPTEIRDQRTILEAQRLLAFSKLPVSEIATRTGIPDAGYFSRFFARHCGQSPREWRRSLDQKRQV